MASTNDRDRPVDLARRLGHEFRRPELLRQALTHSSVAGAQKAEVASYERLEFLGDRVLGLIVADMLLDRFPEEPEGALARRHAFLVSREALADVARGLMLSEALHVSKGEAESGGRQNPATLADVCEAVIGAIYRDGGLGAARVFVEPHWSPMLEQDHKPPQDSKTALQEWAQARGLPLPRYEEVDREGPAHDPRFTVAVHVGDKHPIAGIGRSKRLAEQDAARSMLTHLNTDGNQ